ncbi:MAG TPA: hypothetical protein VGR57_14060, partial [Ktedonobacterales bacterium]|nr:hypothetical protein [Ktedonobacterales bacterium]
MPLDGNGPVATSRSTALLNYGTPEPSINSPLLPDHFTPGAEPTSLPSFGGDDALPWPLPKGIIVDGRYRVELVESASEDANTYAVTDLRGYERCWACDTAYGAAAASE